jgi:purine-binding chemotaxis protein CheW
MTIQRRSFDWEQVRRKMEQSQMQADFALRDRESMETVFRERAARLAQRVRLDTSATFEALVFTLGAERYAIELSGLAEVLPLIGCIAVPGAPRELAGVVNLRGEIRPVLDLARVLALPEAEGRAPGWLLLLRGNGQTVGLRVDQVEKIRSFRSDEVVNPDQNAVRPADGYLKAISKDTIMLLNTDKLLSFHLIKEFS